MVKCGVLFEVIVISLKVRVFKHGRGNGFLGRKNRQHAFLLSGSKAGSHI
jgi:hypothetical protein